MNAIPKRTKNQSTSFLEDITYKYLPYWPLFAVLAVIFGVLAFGYIRVSKPLYEITATILLNDEKKGADEAQLAESLNLPTSKKIVENELEVIQSRKLMDDVVKGLHLYAPLTEKARVKKLSAYSSSPIVVEVQQPDSIKEYKDIHFTWDSLKQSITIDNKSYALNQWVNTGYGLCMFKQNPRYVYKEKPGQFSFSIFKVKQITDGVLKNMDISAVGKLSSIIKLKMKDEVPQRGEDILNSLLDKYNRSSIDFKNSLAKNTLDFLDERLESVANELKTVEKQIQNYKSSRGVTNLGDQGRLYLQNVSENDQKASTLGMKMAVLNQVERYVNSKESSAGIVPATLGVDDPLLSKLLDRLYQTETEYDKVKRTAGENNPMAQTLSSQIESLRPGIMENIQNQKAAISASLGNLNSTNNKYNSVLSTIPQKERELIDVSREQSVKNNAYAFLLQKREQTALAYSSNIADSKVIDAARASVLPVSPKKKIILLGAIIAALALTVVYIAYKEMLTNKILFRKEIEEMSTLPIVGEIAKFNTRKSLLLEGKHFNAIQDQVRQLRAAIGLQHFKNENNKILITSSISGEGKSLLSVQLAISLSLSGKKVVLVDLDIRNPQASKAFDKLNITGATEFLEDLSVLADTLHQTSYNNLWILPASKTNQNPTELLLNGKIEGLINSLTAEFDFIVIDSAPVTEEIDAYILSDFCDISLYVIRHGYTPKRFIKNLDENLLVKPLNNPAIVFNGIKPRGFIKPAKHYGYGYELVKA